MYNQSDDYAMFCSIHPMKLSDNYGKRRQSMAEAAEIKLYFYQKQS